MVMYNTYQRPGTNGTSEGRKEVSDPKNPVNVN